VRSLDQAEVGERLVDVVTWILDQVRRRRERRARTHADGIAVRSGARYRRHADGAGAAKFQVDDHVAVQALVQLHHDQAREDVHRPAKGRDQRDRSLRVSGLREQRCGRKPQGARHRSDARGRGAAIVVVCHERAP
jgi:hypothetical protein